MASAKDEPEESQYNSMPDFTALGGMLSEPSTSNGQAPPDPPDPMASLTPEEKHRLKMHLLVSSFSPEQLNRYEMFRRSTLSKPTLRKVLQQVTGSQVSPSVVIAIAGIAKVFAGEVLEEALDIRDTMGESHEPIKPKHLRMAMGRLKRKGHVVPRVSAKAGKKYFRRL